MKQRVHGSTNGTYRSAIRNPNILLGIDNSVPAVTSVKSFWYVIKRQFDLPALWWFYCMYVIMEH